MSARHSPVEDEPETTGPPAMPRPRAVSRSSASGNSFAGDQERPDAYELIGDGMIGGEGVVWRALDHGLRAPVLCAVKMLTRPTVLDRRLLEQNKRLLQHMSPRNVVRVHEVLYGPPPHPQGRPDSAAPHVVYVIMDWVDGPTLRQAVGGRPATSRSIMERLKYVAQLAGALADLTSMNANATLHRDIKPGNCIIHDRRGLVLVDVTTLRHVDDGFDPAGLHTPEYAAPEVRAAPRRPRSTATEMYSLGALAAFCLTGSDPDVAGSPSTRSRWLADLLRAASGAGVDDPEAFVRHLTQAMDPDPAQRPADLVAWSHTLIQLAVRTPAPQSPPTPAVSGATPRSVRRPKAWAVAAAAVTAIAAAGVAVQLNRDEPGGALVAPPRSTPTAAGSVPVSEPAASSSSRAGPTSAETRSPSRRPAKRTPEIKVGAVVAPRGTIGSPGTGTDIPSCSYFSGSATLPADTTLILTKRNVSTGNPAVYAELVFDWPHPSSLTSWRGAQFFGKGNESSGQSYEVGLRAVPLAAAREFDAGSETDYGQEIAKLGTELDAVRVDRVDGEGPDGCPGP